jgi:hypothetical protein
MSIVFDHPCNLAGCCRRFPEAAMAVWPTGRYRQNVLQAQRRANANAGGAEGGVEGSWASRPAGQAAILSHYYGVVDPPGRSLAEIEAIISRRCAAGSQVLSTDEWQGLCERLAHKYQLRAVIEDITSRALHWLRFSTFLPCRCADMLRTRRRYGRDPLRLWEEEGPGRRLEQELTDVVVRA